MKKRRILAFFLCAMMITGLAACGKKEEEKSTGDAATQAVTEGTSGESSERTSEGTSDGGTEGSTEDTKEARTPIDYLNSDVEEILGRMTTRDKIEQMMIVPYRVWKEVPEGTESEGTTTVENSEDEIPEINVTELNDEIRKDIMSHHYGGTLLFSENYQTAEQTLKLVSDIQQTNLDGGGIPMIVATDQEGGNVYRVEFGTAGVGNMALAATGDPENAKKMASIYGYELSLLGINTDFAPVMDVNNNPGNPVIGVRSFSDSPEVVSEFGAKYIEGLHEMNTIATLKHFPGHGNTDTDSHTGFPRINSSLDELKAFELVPFQKAIDSGADMIMTAHIQYPQIEKETCTSISTGEEVNLPATMSRTILTDVLRKDMGFEGVVVTDALDMGAITENFSDEDVLTLSINAGANMLILPAITDTAIFQHVKDMVDTAVRLTEEGKIDSAMVDDSVRRILTLKKKYGLLDRAEYTVSDEMISAAESGVGSKENRAAEWEIATKALTLVKNDAAFPIHPAEDEKTLILFADSCGSRVETGELVVNKLVADGVLQDASAVSVLVNTPENEEECLQAAAEAAHVILVHRTYDLVNMNPNDENGISSAVFDRIISQRHEDGKKVIVVTIQLPYDAARFTEADAVLLTYNSSPMRELPPESGAGSAYCPNLAAALYACFTEEEVTGKLPVDIYALDADYNITDRILYEREVGK